MQNPAKLALEDGAVFTGYAVGAAGTHVGEVVFNTAMTGYQEVFTDPSYCGQIVTMTFPLQGNYGVNEDDFEASRVYLAGVVLREIPRRPSNFRATASLAEFFRRHDVIAIAGVDTRAITRRIRSAGAMRGALSTEITSDLELVRLAQEARPMAGANLVEQVAPGDFSQFVPGPSECGTVPGSSKGGPAVCAGRRDTADAGASASRPKPQRASAEGAPHVIAVDCGIKRNILRLLVERGCRVTIAPAGASADEILRRRPDGLLVGNGPGDPAAVTGTVQTLRELIGRVPIFGICLGHQLLALALGAETYKLPFGHHGANLPVLDRTTGRVEITSQNHGFAVDAGSLERVGAQVTHVNLNDQSVEGFVHADRGVMAVQFHPEANPGPHDAQHLFDRFLERLALADRCEQTVA